MRDYPGLLIDAVCRVKDLDRTVVSATTPIEDLLMDSLDEVEVMMFLEDELGIEIDQAQIENCITVGDFAAVVERLASRVEKG